ncbi:hypothetical protein F5884DRAFT_849771 [Xylogone sp. PMI_703]|nr:hypothetical protein F5884DRAFT_849771 [Xylogone sp. PMI_703]
MYDDQLQYRFFFRQLNRVTIKWAMTYLRDALTFDYLIETADSEDEEIDINEQMQCKRILHMLSLRLVYGAEAVFSSIIDRSIPVNLDFYASNVAEAATVWRSSS